MDHRGYLLARHARRQRRRTGPTEGDFGVVRVQRDLGRSNIAFQGAGRSLDGESQGSVGLDATLFFTETLGMTGQIVQSFGRDDGDGPGGGTLGGFIRPAYDSATTHFHVRYTYLGNGFADNVNAIGFVRDDNRRELDAEFSRTFWPQGGAFERIKYDSNYNVFWATDSSSLRQWEIRQGLEIDLRNRFAFELDWNEDMQLFEKEFRNRSVELQLGYNTRAFESAQVGYRFGENFDADFRLWTVEAAYKITEQLSAEYELQRLTLDPDPDTESTWIDPRAASGSVLHPRPVRAPFLSDQLGHRPTQRAAHLRVSLPAAVRQPPARLPARYGRVRRTLRPGRHPVREADDGPVTPGRVL